MITDAHFLDLVAGRYSLRFSPQEAEHIFSAFMTITDLADKLYQQNEEQELRELFDLVCSVYHDCSPKLREGIENILLFRASGWSGLELNEGQQCLLPQEFLPLVRQMRYASGI